jgi:alkylation response protein AidB-like acyl-CoA dehydrogenase
MNFDDTPEEASFRRSVREWLQSVAPPRIPGKAGRFQRMREAERLEAVRQWQRLKGERGYAGITLPTRWGGMGGTPIQSVIYSQEEAGFDVPSPLYYMITLGMCIPTLIAYGREEDIEQRVKPALLGDEIWCQLFSEPGAGSDLASVQTRALRQGDGWVVNGQKIWTSGAQYATYGLLVARTDPSAPKHQGLSCFFIDMKARGVTVRPIRQINGESEFNEVFFDDMFVPDTRRLGSVGGGWRVAITTLMHERVAGSGTTRQTDVEEIIDLARSIEWRGGRAIDDPRVRERIADWYVVRQGLKYHTFRALTRLSKGEEPGPEFSIGKLVRASQIQAVGSFGLDLADRLASIAGEYPESLGRFLDTWVWSAASRIAGGTDEILLNIIAERVLGMPPEIAPDKYVPFNESRTS